MAMVRAVAKPTCPSRSRIECAFQGRRCAFPRISSIPNNILIEPLIDMRSICSMGTVSPKATKPGGLKRQEGQRYSTSHTAQAAATAQTRREPRNRLMRQVSPHTFQSLWPPFTTSNPLISCPPQQNRLPQNRQDLAALILVELNRKMFTAAFNPV